MIKNKALYIKVIFKMYLKTQKITLKYFRMPNKKRIISKNRFRKYFLNKNYLFEKIKFIRKLLNSLKKN